MIGLSDLIYNFRKSHPFMDFVVENLVPKEETFTIKGLLKKLKQKQAMQVD